MTLAKIKGMVNKGKNRNLRVVKVRKDRFCHYCSKKILTGAECLTVNKKTEPRYWVCSDCVIKISNYHEAKAFSEIGTFGDEGGYMANQDWLAECEAELEEIEYLDEDDWFGEE